MRANYGVSDIPLMKWVKFFKLLDKMNPESCHGQISIILAELSYTECLWLMIKIAGLVLFPLVSMSATDLKKVFSISERGCSWPV